MEEGMIGTTPAGRKADWPSALVRGSAPAAEGGGAAREERKQHTPITASLRR